VDGLDIVSLDQFLGRWDAHVIDDALCCLLKRFGAGGLVAVSREAAHLRLSGCALVIFTYLVVLILQPVIIISDLSL
jgi:hypothetical protein